MTHLRCEHVSKRYRIRQDDTVSPNLLGRLWRRLRPVTKEFWALSDISFEVEQGESLGVIGPNGAGKSTLLKLLSSITAPTLGRITIGGRIAALLEVGSGFHPELSGLENVFLSGSILGMRRAEISRKLDAIIDFAEIRPFIDVPVKRYSSGMYVRLGFSIAAHLEPDILLLDEVLAVGDAAFQQKCRERIHGLHAKGTTIVFISHDLAAVEEVCGRVFLLNQGRIASCGAPADIILEYQKMAAARRGPDDLSAVSGKVAHITSVRVTDGSGSVSSPFRTGSPLKLRLEYVALEPVDSACFSACFYSPDNVLHTEFTTRASHGGIRLPRGAGSIEFFCPELELQPGIYSVDVTIEAAGSLDPVERLRQCTVMRVDPGRASRGLFHASVHCRVDTDSGAAATNLG